jgi:hypothetical protein
MVSRSTPLRSPSWRRLAVHIAWLAVMALALLPTLVRTVAFAQAGHALPFELCRSARATGPDLSAASGIAGLSGMSAVVTASSDPAAAVDPKDGHAGLDACPLCVLAASAAAVPVPSQPPGHVSAGLTAEPLPSRPAAPRVQDLAATIARPRGPPLNA